MGDAARQHEALEIEYLPGMDRLFSDVFETLGDGARRNFRDEITAAFLEMVRTGNDRPVNETLQAWYRTLLFKQSGVDERLEKLPEFDEADTFTAAEARTYLGL